MIDEKALEAAARAIARYEGYGEFITSLPRARVCVEAYLGALDGVVLVPVEATEEMMARGKRQPNDLQQIYRAMIAARPQNGGE